jgi:zinc protease
LRRGLRITGFLLASTALLGTGAAYAQALESSALMTAPDVPARKKIFNAETFTLENGLQIVVIPNHRAPVVTHMVWYKVGAAEEISGHSGVAHFLEHLMFKGSDNLAPGEFSKKIRSLGGQDNAFTGHDYTSYHQSISVDYLETVMNMESGRMRGMNPPAAEITSENKVILEERRQRTDNNPDARLAEQMNALLYINHPYAKPVIGWMEEIADLSWEQDIKPFYDRYYAPNNAILVVAGDVTGEQVYRLAQKTYGCLASSQTIPPRERTQSPPLAGRPEVTLTDPNISEPAVQIGYRTPSARQNKKESLALTVLDEIMGGGATSRIYKALVVDRKIATGAGFAYRSGAWDDTQAWVYATPAPGQDMRKLKDALNDQLRLLVKDGVTEAELKDAINRLITEAVYARDSLVGPAMIFGSALTTGSTIDDIEYWTYDIAQVTAQDILDVAKKYLDPDMKFAHAPVTGYLVPENPAQLSQQAAPHAPDVAPAAGEIAQ